MAWASTKLAGFGPVLVGPLLNTQCFLYQWIGHVEQKGVATSAADNAVGASAPRHLDSHYASVSSALM